MGDPVIAIIAARERRKGREQVQAMFNQVRAEYGMESIQQQNWRELKTAVKAVGESLSEMFHKTKIGGRSL